MTPGEQRLLLDTVVVPLHELPRDDEAVCELRRSTDGQLALPVYDTVEDLVACCGRAQPWMAVRTDRVAELADATGADLVVPGLELPPELRHGDRQ
ncbi:SAV_915 family protein [Actinomycetospora atypica]|uniref:SAV_915 family protein n=1 Tax=Actinomycetospora atypica TaxID=1290095 RepID=A0ABV9YIQ9_9PSEU